MVVEEDLSAIVLAAGYSSRMSDFKPLLPLGNLTVIEIVIGIFRQAGINDITVVLGHRADDLKPVLDPLHVRWVFNEKYNEGMFSSVVAGLRSLGPGVKGVFLLPVDMPLVKSLTVKKIIRAYRELGAYVFYPTFMDRHGHPPLIPSTLFHEILSWRGPDGLQSLLARHETEAREVDVDDKGILLDIDTPEDYSEIRVIYDQRCIKKEL